MNQWILASTSPRRRELFADLVEDFEVRSPDFEEKWQGEEASQYVVLNAVGKGRSIARESGQQVLSADTVVVLDGRVLEKPKTREQAIEMLESMSGRDHLVMTGYAVHNDQGMTSDVVKTRVSFRKLSRQEIEKYVDSGEPMDKAGAYGIQGKARSMIAAIHGSYTNVMGLPLAEISAAI